MFKFKAFTRKLSGGFDSSKSQKKRSVSDYDKKHDSIESSQSSMHRRAISSTRDIKTKLPPLPTQEYTLSTASTESRDDDDLQPRKSTSRSGKYYVYDRQAYRESQADYPKAGIEYKIFEKRNGINPTSAREVVHHLVLHFKHTLIQQNGVDSHKKMDSIKAAMEIFRPNLSHYVPHEVDETIQILETFFPRDGCSLTGEVLKSKIKEQIGTSKSKLILALRIIWSRFPSGIIPWESYLKFCTIESKQNFSKMSFKNFLPQVLPNDDYRCCAFDFMELIVAIISMVDLVVDKSAQMDLLFTAGQVCFVKTPELLRYIDHKTDQEPDCITLAKLYRARGEALYRLFVSLLNSLAEEGKIKDFYLIDNFRIEEYPPKPYKPITQRALTLTIPQLWDPDTNDFNELIRVAAKAQSRTYSSSHPFSKLENSFLDKFEENPYKVVNSLFSKSSKRYLYKFDPRFDTNFFKSLGRKGTQPSTLGPGDQPAVATWINSCKERGFNDFLSVLDDNNHGEGTLALGFSFPKSNQEDSETLPPVRVSKIEISECFISSWKYETFLGKVHNTLVIKMTKRIGDCEWLVIAMDERTERYGYAPLSKSSEATREPDWSAMSTPPLPPKNTLEFHSASDSMSSTKSRPPPPSLLGERSSSPLLDSSTGVFSDRASTRLSSRPGSSSVTSVYSVAKHHRKNNSSLEQRKIIAMGSYESPLQHSSPVTNSSQLDYYNRHLSNSSRMEDGFSHSKTASEDVSSFTSLIHRSVPEEPEQEKTHIPSVLSNSQTAEEDVLSEKEEVPKTEDVSTGGIEEKSSATEDEEDSQGTETKSTTVIASEITEAQEVINESVVEADEPNAVADNQSVEKQLHSPVARKFNSLQLEDSDDEAVNAEQKSTSSSGRPVVEDTESLAITQHTDAKSVQDGSSTRASSTLEGKEADTSRDLNVESSDSREANSSQISDTHSSKLAEPVEISAQAELTDENGEQASLTEQEDFISIKSAEGEEGNLSAAELAEINCTPHKNLSDDKAEATLSKSATQASELVLPSPIPPHMRAQDESARVFTPINMGPPNELPKIPMKMQNPSVASFEDTTLQPESNDTTASGDTPITSPEPDKGLPLENQASEDIVPKDSERYANSVQKKNPHVPVDALKSKTLTQDVLTEDLLSDLLENYDTLSTEPINSENGPTVFERVKVYFERQGKDAQDIQPGSPEASSPATENSKDETIDSKTGTGTGTWFSCNVTPPNRSGKRMKNPKNLQLNAIDTPLYKNAVISRTPSGAIRVPEKNGVWLELEDNPSSPAELSSPTQVMFRNMMIKTKRSFRSLKKNDV